MTQAGKYLYCIVRCGEECTFDGVAPIGGGAASVYTVPHGDLAVVVSDATTREYESSRSNMLAHQRVQERVLEEFTLLPVRFGTIADGAASDESIRKLLKKRRQEFKQLLADLDGTVELGLKALWRDEKAVFGEIADREKDIARLRDSLRGKPPLASHYERIRLGEMVKEALERQRKVEAQSILAPLRQIAQRTIENPVIVDRMIINAAFLVDKGREEELDRGVSSLNEELGKRVSFRYVGPVPPYNFVNVVVNWQEL